jgi:hypothetical protein
MFDKARIKQWRRDISKEMHKIGLPSDTPEFDTGRVLAAVYGFGTDVDVLVEVTGYSAKYVRDVLKRCRKARIIVGQRLRVAWNEHGISLGLDAMVASGVCTRPPDPKRSAAQKARRQPAMRAPRRPRTVVAKGAVFTPKVTPADPYYGLSEWEKKR